VWGGKITTFRKLAEEAADLLSPPLGGARRTGPNRRFLPGGDLSWPGAATPTAPRPTDIAASTPNWRAATPNCRAHAQALGAQLRRSVTLAAGDGPLGAEVAPGPVRGRAAAPARPTNGRAAPTTCCGAAASWACTTTPPRVVCRTLAGGTGPCAGSVPIEEKAWS
jgi:hypothetical protein